MKYEAIAQCGRPRVILIVTAVLLCGVAQQAALSAPPGIERVSVSSGGTQGNGWSGPAAISADSRFVAFVSQASNLVEGDTNGDGDIFVHDRLAGQTTRVSVSSDGTQGNDWSGQPSISADGRFVAFSSRANNLVSRDTNEYSDIFVHDRQTGATERITYSVILMAPLTGDSMAPSISADGRFVAFSSESINLIEGDINGHSDIFVRDRQTDTTERITFSVIPRTLVNGNSSSPCISADGRFVAFSSFASNLVPGDTNGFYDVFVHDRQTGQTTRASLSPDGTQANDSSYMPSISADGRFVAFSSEVWTPCPTGIDYRRNVFVRDRQTGTTELVGVTTQTEQPGHSSPSTAISAGGRYVAYEYYMPPAQPYISYCAVHIYDRQLGITYRISSGYTQSWSPSISGNGRIVAFFSPSDDLVSNDTNNSKDAFVYDRGWRLAVAISGGGKGIVDLDPTGGVYAQGETVTIAAESFPSSRFDHWEGNLTGSDNPTEVLMDGDKTVTAHFIRQCFVSVKSVLPTGISITGDKPGTTDYVATCDDGKILHLTAPESVAVGDMVWYFQYWAAYNEHALPVPLLLDGQVAADMELLIDRDRTLMAVYDWRPEGDVNRDCTVNILDMLSVRNRLQTGCVPSP